jgi:hypothetical protein
MKLFLYAAVVIVLGLGTAGADDFDGSKVLICATTEAMDCMSADNCTKGRAGDIGAPKFLRIDFAKKIIYGPKRSTSIGNMEIADQQILLQGKEMEYGWTLVLDQENGNMTASLVNRDGVFVLFGSCTPL